MIIFLVDRIFVFYKKPVLLFIIISITKTLKSMNVAVLSLTTI